jgi:ring-1,2-phenylacetyl-CoA epoxidase subunit PaaC
MVRQLLYGAFVHPYFQALARSTHEGLSEIAAKAVKEMAYHVRHSAEWVIRLGDGTDESRRRTIAALEALWPYVDELFESGEDERVLVEAGIAPEREAQRVLWDKVIDRVLDDAGLYRPERIGAARRGGRGGRHVHLAEMLADMQSLARAHPGAVW